MIEVSHVHFSYAGQKAPVFSDFSLELKENSIYGLLGKNGTGKSTLLGLMAGLLRPQSGTVCLNGTETWRRQPAVLSDIFMVPEEFDQPQMSLSEYVSINQPFYPRFSREVLEACLEDFELPQTLQLNSLSMGQRKKVFMSFALAAGTRLLLMDEPTNGLDIPSKSQFRKIVARHMTDDRTLVISTHQVHDVEQLLDHLLILGPDGLMLNEPVSTVAERYVFEHRQSDDIADAIYAEPSLQGYSVMARRQAGSAETQVNLELFFNSLTKEKQ